MATSKAAERWKWFVIAVYAFVSVMLFGDSQLARARENLCNLDGATVNYCALFVYSGHGVRLDLYGKDNGVPFRFRAAPPVAERPSHD